MELNRTNWTLTHVPRLIFPLYDTTQQTERLPKSKLNATNDIKNDDKLPPARENFFRATIDIGKVGLVSTLERAYSSAN